MNDNKPPREPLLNLPPATQGMIVIMLLIHAGITLMLDPPARYDIYSHFGFISAVYTGLESPWWQKLAAPFTYAFLHGSWAHVLVNVAMLAAFGTGVERWLGGGRMILLFMLCSISAVFFNFLLDPHTTIPVIGASGGISGLFAAILLRRGGQGAVGTRTAMIFAAIWIVTAVLFGIIGAPDGSPVAWLAHIGGFLGGFVFLRPVEKLSFGQRQI